MMGNWTDSRDGFARLGTEYTPDYRGYVINVRDEGEDWYVYAWDERNGVTAYLARAATENAAREILEIHAGIRRSGFLCEAWVSEEVGHCPEDATGVRWLDSERTGKRVRLLFCPAHSHIFSALTWDPISTYRDEWGIEPEASRIIGGRRGPVREGEPTWVVMVDHACQAPYVRSTLRRALAKTEPTWSDTDYVNAARSLVFKLPDHGPWYLTRVELHTIRIALERRRARYGRFTGPGNYEAHEVIAQRITWASEYAIRRRQQDLS
ncbi:hypothetical protein ACIRVF_11425 [Kitasatospora sp. NPDC101157]|uniref:hypothetical protein n=1 Tax=Kitasatospora sp. NPDC101157 TaxID=3364098 RepID=UPI00381F55F9